MYELSEGMPTGGGRFHGMLDVLNRFLPSLYAPFDVRFVFEEMISEGDRAVVLGRRRGRTRQGGVSIDVPFAHVWTVADHELTRLRVFIDTATLARALESPRR